MSIVSCIIITKYQNYAHTHTQESKKIMVEQKNEHEW